MFLFQKDSYICLLNQLLSCPASLKLIKLKNQDYPSTIAGIFLLVGVNKIIHNIKQK